MNNDDIYLLLWHINGIGPKTIEYLKQHFGDLSIILSLTESEILAIPNLKKDIKENLLYCIKSDKLSSIKKTLESQNVKYLTVGNKDYPSKLKNINDRPYVIFYRGDASILNQFSIAIVGSRKATQYGIWCAKNLGQGLSEMGINIVSGMALGVDYYSHVGAMGGKSKTIAVLGSSIDKPYPKENIKLMDSIVESGGCIVSEYILGTSPKPGYFPMRNRIISGLSDGVLLIEAGEKSGSLITMDWALEQGKNVFAVPGNINSFYSKGCNKIIKEGAKLVSSVEDILEEYEISIYNEIAKNVQNFEQLSLEELNVVNLLKNKGTLDVEYISEFLGLNIKNILGILNVLDIKGIVAEVGNKMYCINDL